VDLCPIAVYSLIHLCIVQLPISWSLIVLTACSIVCRNLGYHSTSRWISWYAASFFFFPYLIHHCSYILWACRILSKLNSIHVWLYCAVCILTFVWIEKNCLAGDSCSYSMFPKSWYAASFLFYLIHHCSYILWSLQNSIKTKVYSCLVIIKPKLSRTSFTISHYAGEEKQFIFIFSFAQFC
jgi:hypothetical protein